MKTARRVTLEVAKEIRPEHIYFYHTSAPNTLVNITGLMDKKIEARLVHKSQNKQSFYYFEQVL